MTVGKQRSHRRVTLKSGGFVNLFVAIMVVGFMTALLSPVWASVGSGFIVWLVLEVHRDLLSAIEHQQSGKAD